MVSGTVLTDRIASRAGPSQGLTGAPAATSSLSPPPSTTWVKPRSRIVCVAAADPPGGSTKSQR